MASDLLFCSGARTRTWDLRVMSFAPEKGASATPFMFPRLPDVLRCSRARMSSTARPNHTIVDRGHDVNGEIELRADSVGTTAVRHSPRSCCSCHTR